MNKKIYVFLLICFAAFSMNAQKKGNSKKAPKSPVTKTTTVGKSTTKNTKMSKQPGIYAIFETDKGNVTVQLEYKKTPMTCANFIGLAEGKLSNTAKPAGTPYYDGLKFHRVITKGNGDDQDFMVQGGCPLGTGTGDPGYKFPDEFDPSLKHDKPGVLSMANSGPGTNGSQFFLTVVPTPWLDNRHSVFGFVIDGLDVLNKVKTGDIMNKVKIERVGAEAIAFKADQASFDSYKGGAAKKAEEAQKAEMAKRQEMMKEVQRKNAEAAKTDRGGFEAEVKKMYPTATILPSGLAYVMTTKGTGDNAKPGNTVSVHYNGAFTDGKKFDASYDRNEPITFQLGQGMVIPGWEEGIALLNKGAKAKLIIPYWLAYGLDGRPPVIPAKSTLVFDTEMVDIK